MTSPAKDQADEQAAPQQPPDDKPSVEVKVDGSQETTVSAAGRDVFTGNFFIFNNLTDATAVSSSLETLAKKFAGNVTGAMAEVRKERRQDEKLEEETAPRTAEKEAPRDLADEVAQWFRQELSTAHEKYFAIVLSLFDGLKWSDFWDIYQAILASRDLLEDEKDKKEAALFGQTDEELVAKARARIVRKEKQAAEIVEFKEAGYPQAILDLLRRQYRPRLVELLPGLGQLGKHPYWEIRARAAYAVAEVGKLDFHRARHQVLEPWAQDDRPYVRAAVGYVASRLLQDKVADSEMRNLLEEWANPKENFNWKLRWTAAAAYKQVGLSDPEAALKGLRVAAGNDDLRVTDAVIYALLVISFDDKLAVVLGTLQEWLSEDEGSKKEPNIVPLVATFAFLALGKAYTGLAEQAAGEDQDKEEKEGDRLLTLLASEHDGVGRAVVLAAMTKALKHRLMDETFEVLRDWMRETGGNAARRGTVRDLIADWYMTLWQNRHQIGMSGVVNRLERWARGDDAPVREAAQVTLAEIKRRVNAAPLSAVPAKSDPKKPIVFGS